MAGNRKKAQAVLLKMFKRLDIDGFDYKQLEANVTAMTDSQFDKFMTDLESGIAELHLTIPIGNEVKFTMEHIFACADEFEHVFHERIWIDNKDGTPPYLSNEAYLIIDGPVRRQAQHFSKKASVPVDNSTIDHLTGQVTGPSKGTTVSGPEANVAVALGMVESLTELYKIRGGDNKALNAMNREIAQRGGASLDEILKLNTKVKSTQAVDTILTCMHIKSTLMDP